MSPKQYKKKAEKDMEDFVQRVYKEMEMTGSGKLPYQIKESITQETDFNFLALKERFRKDGWVLTRNFSPTSLSFNREPDNCNYFLDELKT